MIQTSLLNTDIDNALLTQLGAYLSESEVHRAARFRQPKDRRNYIVAHAALRILLGRQLDIPPNNLTFSAGRWGKPTLTPADKQGLYFNLSHSGDMALIAIASAPVGVDIEQARPLDYMHLARHCFASEEVARISDSKSFFEIWTAKEAVVKASGQGLAKKLQQFVVPRASSALQAIHLCMPDPTLDGLHVMRLTSPEGYYSALSTAHTGPLLQTQNLTTSLLV